MEGLVGQSLDRYKLVSLLGEGGMGAVFKGHDVTLQRDVAIKVMHPHVARRSDFQERFLQEARTAAQLDHPGIVKVFDFGQARKNLYIVMEFIPGANLRELLKELRAEDKWIVLEEGVELVRQVSLAVDYAHKKKVLHRDLKPENIMLKAEASDPLPYRPVLTDLGLAKLLTEGGLVTQAGTSMGTPAYMSPEQALGNVTDSRSDVYSLGILLFELAVGRLPFPARTITEAIRYHTREAPPEPRSIRPDLPEMLEGVILKALEKAPEDRYQDAKALAQAMGETKEAPDEMPMEPTLLEGSVSLVTHLEQSMVEARGPSIFEAFPQVPEDLRQDRITIQLPDATSRSTPIKADGMTIGREEDNDLVLDRDDVSRHHARITFDGTNYHVTDLNSTNGTFLANTKLLPGVSEVWTVETPLRVGDVWLRLERRKVAAPSALFLSDGTMVDPSLVRSSGGEGRVGVFLEVTEYSVEPGSSVPLTVVALNQGPVVDHFNVKFAGIPPEWVTVPPPLRLMPGVQQEVQVTIRPPRTPESRSGRYPITVLVASQDDPGQVAGAEAGLTVAPFYQYRSMLKPQRVKAGKPAQVSIENHGNIQQTFGLAWEDRADELKFRPPQAQLAVSEGKTAVAEYRARPRRRRWIGGRETHSFMASVNPAIGDAQTLTGEVISRGLIPRWLITFLILAVVLAMAALVAWWASEQRSQTSAQQTLDAAVAATLTYDASAMNALTATALWLAGDDDYDGLTNGDEQDIHGTDPLNIDTDGDGLSDKDEIAVWGTDPLAKDTDGDGKNDGLEVENGWNPKSPDTDGDGTPDGSDDDPGKMPTLTPSPSPPPTGTATKTIKIEIYRPPIKVYPFKSSTPTP